MILEAHGFAGNPDGLSANQFQHVAQFAEKGIEILTDWRVTGTLVDIEIAGKIPVPGRSLLDGVGNCVDRLEYGAPQDHDTDRSGCGCQQQAANQNAPGSGAGAATDQRVQRG